MRKSIYYLIANALSTIAVAIFIACVQGTFPVFGFDLRVNSIVSCWTPMIILLPVLALSIIICAQDVVSFNDHGKDSKKVPFGTLKDVLMGFVTIVSILIAWVSAILVFGDYIVGNTISVPFYFIGAFVIAIALILLFPILFKNNQNLQASIVPAALLLMISGFLYEVLPYWYVLVAGLGTTLIVFGALYFLSRLSTKR